MQPLCILKAVSIAAAACFSQPAFAQAMGDSAEETLPRPDSGRGAGSVTRQGVPLRTGVTLVSPMRPRTDPKDWVSNADYPAEARAEKASGEVSFQLLVDDEGKVKACRVAKSSGSQTLDKATCTLLRQRARFHPGVTSDEQAAGGMWEGAVRWTWPG